MKFFKFTVVLTPEKEGKETYYNVAVPSFPEIATFGDSPEEARFMAQDALELVILSRLEDGEIIPQDKKPKKSTKGALTEEVIITVHHQVTASPADHVKNALLQGSRSA